MTDDAEGRSRVVSEEKVTHHYGGKDLAACILAKLESSGIPQEALQPDDLAPYEEMSRVLKHGGIMGIFDIMRKSDDALTFPVP